MEEILARIEKSLDDGFLSKEEKRTLKQMFIQQHLSANDRMDLIIQAIRFAEQRADKKNYRAVVRWLKKVSKLLAKEFQEHFHNNAFFSHTHDIRKHVIDEILAAKISIDICMFTISDDMIADAITAVFKNGIKTRIITDDEKVMDKGSDIFKLKYRGIQIKIDSIKSLMHHKFSIIDSHKVITGSYNWTRTGSEVNNENIIISDHRNIVNAFQDEFNRLWDQMTPL